MKWKKNFDEFITTMLPKIYETNLRNRVKWHV